MQTYPTGVIRQSGGPVTPNAWRFFSTPAEAAMLLELVHRVVPNAVLSVETTGLLNFGAGIPYNSQFGQIAGGIGESFMADSDAPQVFQIRGTTDTATTGKNVNENVGELLLRLVRPAGGDVRGGTRLRIQDIGEADAELHWA